MKRLLCTILFGSFACAQATPAPVEDSQDAGTTVFPEQNTAPGTVIVHLFEWPWNDIASECEEVLGPAKALAVQVSPPMEHAVLDTWVWYDRYQPVRYSLEGRGGGKDAFVDMVKRCTEAGVEVYVDIVLNHMSGVQGQGTDGSTFEKYLYPSLFSDENFHSCRELIDFGDLYSNWNCELAGLPDLDTSQPYVQATQIAFVEELLDIGVAGFRLDAAKHMSPDDIRAVLGNLSRQVPIYQEIIGGGPDEPVQAQWYFEFGRVTEFNFGIRLSDVFRTGNLDWLKDFGELWGFHPSDNALTFVDNHDNQRGHGAGSPLTFVDGPLYRLANIFAMAWPYGQFRMMSSYTFEDRDAGPPRNADGNVLSPRAKDSDDCRGEWVCEHRDIGILGMMGFRNATDHAPQILRWWSQGERQIAFARGNFGFVAINREETEVLDTELQTGLPSGSYCDVIGGGVAADGTCVGTRIEVGTRGKAHFAVPAMDAVAIHHLAKPVR